MNGLVLSAAWSHFALFSFTLCTQTHLVWTFYTSWFVSPTKGSIFYAGDSVSVWSMQMTGCRCIVVMWQSSQGPRLWRSRVNPRMASLHLLFFLTCSNLVLIRGELSLSRATLHFTSGHSFNACLETASWKTLYPFAWLRKMFFFVLCVFYAFKWYCRALLSSMCLHLELRLYRPHIPVSYSPYHYICGIWATVTLV